MTTVTIPEGMTPAGALSRLYNASQPLGMGFLHFTPEDMSEDQASQLLTKAQPVSGSVYFDYLKGRVMKVGIPVDGSREIDTRLYDRDNGSGAGARALGGTQ